MLRRMHSDVLSELERVGTFPYEDDTVRLYHATGTREAEAIIAESKLRPQEPEDPAERQLSGGGGSVYLSSSPDIGADLATGKVLLAVNVAVGSTPAEVLRGCWGDPPRVELVVQLRAGEELSLPFVDRLDRTVALGDLSRSVQEAVGLFETSEVGQQLADHEEKEGRCQRASMRFLSALREKGADGRLLAWEGERWWHCGVLIADSDDVLLDWTASQFETEEAPSEVPYPRIETRARADARWGTSCELDIDSPLGRNVAGLPELVPWREAQKRIPDRNSDQAATNRH